MIFILDLFRAFKQTVPFNCPGKIIILIDCVKAGLLDAILGKILGDRGWGVNHNRVKSSVVSDPLVQT